MDHSGHENTIAAMTTSDGSSVSSLMGFFSEEYFMPHGHCFLWKPWLLWTHVISDFLIGLAYLAISISLYFIIRRVRIQFSAVVLAFGTFIGACGITHFMGIWNMWQADYWASGFVKIITAIASVATSIWLLKLRPQIFKVAEASHLAEQRRLDLEALTQDLESRVEQRTRDLAESRWRAQAEEEKLRIITDSIPALVASVDIDGKYQMANKAYLHWIKQDFESIAGKHLREGIGEPAYRKIAPFFEKALKGEAVNFEIRQTYPSGLRYVSVNYIPTRNEVHEVDRIIVIINDLTEMKEAFKAIEEAKIKAEEANQAKSAFLANMSHEIRTPLGAMIGFAQILIEDKPSLSQEYNSLLTIKRNGEQLFRIINEILDISKIEANKLEVEQIVFDPKEVIDDALALLEFKAKEKGLKFTSRTMGALPATITSDPTRIRQILINIVGNAIKFTDSGEIETSFQIVQPETPSAKLKRNALLCVKVRDTGPGIPESKRAFLFKPFSQADHSMARKFGGTGLGLYLSRRLAQALGGDVKLDEEHHGPGATFTILINTGADIEALFKTPNRPQAAAHPGTTSKKYERLDGIRVVTVDDSQDNLELVFRFLSLAGADVQIFDSAERAIPKILEQKFDVVLMDLMMPDLDGYQALTRLRNSNYGGTIIALTAHAMRGERERCLKMGFDDFLVKPINRLDLTRVVKAYATEKRENSEEL